MFLDNVVAGAGWDVVTVRPDRGPRIIREERPQKFVAIILAKRILTRAHRVAHRKRSLALCRGRASIGICGGVRLCWRNQLEGNPRLTGPSGRIELCGLA